jgi:formate dehydrogenase subunit delta
VSADTEERLVHMANQIVRNLRLDATPAATAADHIQAFWSPRMKQQIFALVAEDAAGALDPTARDALALLAAKQD